VFDYHLTNRDKSNYPRKVNWWFSPILKQQGLYWQEAEKHQTASNESLAEADNLLSCIEFIRKKI
jgi:hypothetical protein